MRIKMYLSNSEFLHAASEGGGRHPEDFSSTILSADAAVGVTQYFFDVCTLHLVHCSELGFGGRILHRGLDFTNTLQFGEGRLQIGTRRKDD